MASNRPFCVFNLNFNNRTVPESFTDYRPDVWRVLIQTPEAENANFSVDMYRPANTMKAKHYMSGQLSPSSIVERWKADEVGDTPERKAEFARPKSEKNVWKYLFSGLNPSDPRFNVKVSFLGVADAAILFNLWNKHEEDGKSWTIEDVRSFKQKCFNGKDSSVWEVEEFNESGDIVTTVVQASAVVFYCYSINQDRAGFFVPLFPSNMSENNQKEGTEFTALRHLEFSFYLHSEMERRFNEMSKELALRSQEAESAKAAAEKLEELVVSLQDKLKKTEDNIMTLFQKVELTTK